MTKLITIPKFAEPPVCRTGSVFTWLERARFRLSLSDAVAGSMCAGWSNGWRPAVIALRGKNRRHNIGRSRASLNAGEPRSAAR